MKIKKRALEIKGHSTVMSFSISVYFINSSENNAKHKITATFRTFKTFKNTVQTPLNFKSVPNKKAECSFNTDANKM